METASGFHKGPGGLHSYKVGVDVLSSGYDGTSASGPVLIERSDRTLARKLDFDGATVQSVHGTDIAVFAQDRFQPNMRVQPEFGIRVDHDAFSQNSGVAPRAGMALVLNESAQAVLRGGYGLFFERTPSIAGAFGQFESALDTRFAQDGTTALGPPVPYAHVTAPLLQATRSAIWDLAYENHLNRRVTLTLAILHRQDSHGLIVDPVQTAGGAALLLSSDGRAEYLQQTAGVHVTRGTLLDLHASYVHSSSREDLNSLTNFFDSVMQPIIGRNAYAPGPADAPNRLFVRGSLTPTAGWLFLGTLDWRSGLPWSVVNEDLEFVGPRNDQRFPTYLRLNAGFEHRVRISRMQPWLGLRVSNALNSFLPSDVYSNLGSPDFGTFANSEYREFRIHLRFER